ncbi:MAG: methionine--tRNA ligase [Cytophagales bacterium]|nr:methionine--tRNA ligase [Cytophagales bacterium]MDW8384803.1 methionine--tRNA ligase [Flammeovirgaceae bacterium]
MSKFQRYTVTAALPYANGPLHIGHIAGAYLPADIYVRWLRMKGEDVVFICGSDEHGAAITVKARKEGLTPQAVVDKYHEHIQKTFERFGISFDIYYRTSDKLHYQISQEFFLKLYEKGHFIEEETEQYYDEEAKQFLADRYIIGTCPKCSYENAYGDQCERCGASLSPSELLNPRSALSGSTPVLRKTKHWYLPLNLHEKWIRTWIENGTLEGEQHHDPEEWKNHVLGQCKSWLDAGLQPRAMTRDLDWGVPVPLPEAEGKVLYVWLDAPIGYISATQAWAMQKNKDWKPYWQAEDTKLVHFIGKDNIVFHCIIFPILLKLHGDYILPHNVPANEFLNLEGNKISTSRNWAVWLHEYLDEFPDKRDVLKYVLTSILPETKDSEFTWKDFQQRNNNELADILGNFVNRVIVLTNKYYNGYAPAPDKYYDNDKETISEIIRIVRRVDELIGEYKFKEAQFEVMNLARLGNRYLADNAPWNLAKDPNNSSRIRTIMHVALQITANLSIILYPFLPDTAAKIQRMLRIDIATWIEAGRMNLIPENHRISPNAEILFQKIEDSVIEKQLAKLETAKLSVNDSVAPIKENISYEDFSKLDLRIATITHAEKIPKTQKLLKLTLAVGTDTRTVVSGIAEHYTPEQIVGKQVVLLANLAPKVIKGIESKGMILMAQNRNGTLAFLQPDKVIENGGIVS